MAGPPFQSNKLNKLLMIRQIENVRRYTKCWKELAGALMNGAAYWTVMNYEAIWLPALFHLKLILTGTWATVLDTMEPVMTPKATFRHIVELALRKIVGPGGQFFTWREVLSLIHHNCLQALICVNHIVARRDVRRIRTSTATAAPLLSALILTDRILLWQQLKNGPLPQMLHCYCNPAPICLSSQSHNSHCVKHLFRDEALRDEEEGRSCRFRPRCLNANSW